MLITSFPTHSIVTDLTLILFATISVKSETCIGINFVFLKIGKKAEDLITS